MDTDKIKVFGARLRVDATGKLAEFERAEKVFSIQDLFHVLFSIESVLIVRIK